MLRAKQHRNWERIDEKQISFQYNWKGDFSNTGWNTIKHIRGRLVVAKQTAVCWKCDRPILKGEHKYNTNRVGALYPKDLCVSCVAEMLGESKP